MSFCMRKKGKKKRSSSTSSSAPLPHRHHSTKRKQHLSNKKKKEDHIHNHTDPITEEEKEMSRDIIQCYIKPRMKQLLISVINSSFKHKQQQSSRFNAIMKSGKEVIIDKKYADQLLKLNLCFEINPNLSQTLNQNDCKSFADDIIEGFEYDIINYCLSKVQRWEKLVSLWSFLKYLKREVPESPPEKVDEELIKETIIAPEEEVIQEQFETQIKLEDVEVVAPMQEVEIKANEKSASPASTIAEGSNSVQLFTKIKTDKQQSTNSEIQQIPPESSGRRISLIGDVPKLGLDRRKSNGILKLSPLNKRSSLNKKRATEQPEKPDKTMNQSRSPTNAVSPARQSKRGWSEYDSIPDPDKEDVYI